MGAATVVVTPGTVVEGAVGFGSWPASRRVGAPTASASQARGRLSRRAWETAWNGRTAARAAARRQPSGWMSATFATPSAFSSIAARQATRIVSSAAPAGRCTRPPSTVPLTLGRAGSTRGSGRGPTRRGGRGTGGGGGGREGEAAMGDQNWK
jgi:hypothetical protein